MCSDDGTNPPLQGHQYQANLVMLLLIISVYKKLKEIVIRTEVQEKYAGKFDDILVEEGNNKYTFIQLKHKGERKNKKKLKPNPKINESQLFSGLQSDYSLLKFVCSYSNIEQNENIPKDAIKDAILFTNIELKLGCQNFSEEETNKIWYLEFGKIKSKKVNLREDSLLNNIHPNVEYHQFNDDDDTVVKVLMKQIERINKDKKASDVDKAKLENLTEENVKMYLKKIIYAVKQPNEEDLNEIIKEKLKKNFNFRSPNEVHNILNTRIIRWLSTKQRYFPDIDNTDQKIITYNDIQFFFNKYIQQEAINYEPPTSFIVGRHTEVDQIYKVFLKNNEKNEVLLIGLGGIGKTQLAKIFVENYLKLKCFFKTVIWINSKDGETIKDSFKNVCKKVGICLLKLNEESRVLIDNNFRDPNLYKYVEKSDVEIIDEIIQYCKDDKVLIVIDNLDTINEYDVENYFLDLRKKTQKTNIYILTTSRNEKYYNETIGLINLNVLNQNDSIELIKQQLPDVSKSDATLLCEKLQNFPLALQQAISYIIEQNKIKILFGATYSIQNYIDDFNDNKQTKNLLEFKPEHNSIHDFSKTIFDIWKKTLDAIKKEKYGPTAVKILQIMAYLDPTTITVSEFLSIFDQTDKEIGGAFLLLEKYSLIMREEKTSHIFQMNKLIQKVIQIQIEDQ